MPSADDAERVRMSNVPDSNVTLDIPTTMLLNMNGAEGDVECKIVAPSGREDDCFITPLGEGKHMNMNFNKKYMLAKVACEKFDIKDKNIVHVVFNRSLNYF